MIVFHITVASHRRCPFHHENSQNQRAPKVEDWVVRLSTISDNLRDHDVPFGFSFQWRHGGTPLLKTPMTWGKIPHPHPRPWHRTSLASAFATDLWLPANPFPWYWDSSQWGTQNEFWSNTKQGCFLGAIELIWGRDWWINCPTFIDYNNNFLDYIHMFDA
jgi:hypothetical protein